MFVAIMQSGFLPWRGYVDMLDDVDVFVLFDDVAYTSKSWRTRNRIKTETGPAWISVPVRHQWPRATIDRTHIDTSQAWQNRIAGQIHQAYRRTPYYGRYVDGLLERLNGGHVTVSELNASLLAWLCTTLGIDTEIRSARDFAASGAGEDRVLDLLGKLGATRFVNGPTAEAYSTPERYRDAGIELFYKVYDYPDYPQVNGPFAPQMSVIDLLFNCGPEARSYLKSRVAMRPG